VEDLKTIHFKEEDSIGYITLNRPEKLNAFNFRMMSEMLSVFDHIDSQDSIKAVIITGKGRAFCAGADLSAGADTFNSEFDTSAKYEAEFRRDSGGILTLRMYHCLKPILVACNGDAVGIGASLQLAADIRVASSSCRFGFVFAKRGIVPEAASSWFLPRLVGITKALELCYSGKIISAKEAEDINLVSEVLPKEQLLDRALAVANEFTAESSQISIALTRQMMWRMLGADDPMEAHKIDSRGVFELGQSGEAIEGVKSFLEKRPPSFPGKVSKDMPSFYPWWDEKEFE
jgi:enoyl-CoA hydratase/carnithine racemase